VIQNAEDFYNWGSAQEEKSQIKYIFVPKSQCKDAEQDIGAFQVKPVKGTFEIHSVVPLGGGNVGVRSTSWFCDRCFSSGNFHPSCDGWNQVKIIQDMNEADESEPRFDETMPTQEYSNSDHDESKVYDINSFVAAEYDGKWYLGKVLDFDPEDLEYNITFMEEGKNKKFYSFKWLQNSDNIWIAESSVICKVNEPVLSGSGTRKVYRLDSKDR